MTRSHSSIVYEPNKYIKEGFFSLWRQMFLDVRTSSDLGFRLFLRDFTAKYKQSLLGILWVIILPLFAVGVFVAMNRSGVLTFETTGIPYPVFALFGITLWSLFTGLTSSISGVVGQTDGLVTKINFPRVALVQSPILTSVVDFLIRLILLLVVMLIYRTPPDRSAFFLPLTLFPIFFISIGIGMFLSIIGAVFKDIPNFVNMFLSIAMFLTPVMYPLPSSGILKQINSYNPLYYFVEIPRTIFFQGIFDHRNEFLTFTLISALIFLAGWRFYQVAMARIVEKI
jgi:lipopolysaccharide transport system permease protein